MTKISVIIPVYNKEKYIEACLKSVDKQTFKDFEVLIIDDGSTDRSKQIIDCFITNRPRYTLLNGKHNGVAEARNIGLKNATGEWVTFIDADDWIEDDYLETLYSEQNEADLVVSGLLEFNNGKYTTSVEIDDSRLRFPTQESISQIFSYKWYPIFSIAVTKLYLRKIIEDHQIYFEKQQYGEDSLFVIEYLKFTNNIKTLSYSGYVNRIIKGTLSHQFRDDVWQVTLEQTKRINLNCNLDYSQEWQYMYCRSIKLALLNARGDWHQFRNQIKEIVHDDDFNKIQKSSFERKSDAVILFLLSHKFWHLLFLVYRIKF